MTSQDNARYVTVEMFNDGIARIEHTMTEMREEIHINTVKIDELHYFIGIGFAIMAVVVTLVGFVITLAPMFREMYRDRKQAKSEQIKSEILSTLRGEMQSAIDAAISRALSANKQ